MKNTKTHSVFVFKCEQVASIPRVRPARFHVLYGPANGIFYVHNQTPTRSTTSGVPQYDRFCETYYIWYFRFPEVFVFLTERECQGSHDLVNAGADRFLRSFLTRLSPQHSTYIFLSFCISVWTFWDLGRFLLSCVAARFFGAPAGERSPPSCEPQYT